MTEDDSTSGSTGTGTGSTGTGSGSTGTGNDNTGTDNRLCPSVPVDSI